MMALYNIYRPIEIDYTISFDEKNKAMEKWYKSVMNLYLEYGITDEKIKESVQSSNVEFRQGAKELLKDMYENNVPVIILSAGIGNVIEEVLKLKECYFGNIKIISNFIKFDENGKMKELPKSIIHSLNKNLTGNISSRLENELQKRGNYLLVGDLIEDKKMVDKKDWDRTISIGFLDFKIEENLKVYRDNFDIVLTPDDADFKVVKEIIK